MNAAMVDWWTVPGDTWGVKNLDFKVELRSERVTRPYGSDYSKADLDAFEIGGWGYVEITVIPVDRELNDLVQYRTSLDGVEWGSLSDATVDRGEVTEVQARDLALEAVRAMSGRFEVKAEESSDFKVKAPF